MFTVAKSKELDDSAEKVGASLMKQLAAVESGKDRGFLETDALDRSSFSFANAPLSLVRRSLVPAVPGYPHDTCIAVACGLYYSCASACVGCLQSPTSDHYDY